MLESTRGWDSMKTKSYKIEKKIPDSEMVHRLNSRYNEEREIIRNIISQKMKF